MSETLTRDTPVRPGEPDGAPAPGPVPPTRSGWVLYDGSCGFCARWVPFWAGVLRRRGFDIAPLQSPWVAEALALDDGAVIDDLRLVRPDGSHVSGADVYRYVWRRIGWARPFALLASAPGLRRVFDWGYRTFADNRYRFSKACGLPPVER